ncbi:hypothetical protein GOBAR_AA05575 [Gossypium barbadense]|uniref:Phorbol-ester/DAG-type domain-containing protein n=1 Tax=Gossypium barbadense TaxID=3634 RepID=A0A2P5YHA7_GOSBA|nr:hypothetical protein GOBAR_AA05575 [Gossypium barbadense]
MLNEEQLIGNGNGVVDCSRCGEKVSAPCFICVECCGFYLHKTCAEAPLELNHPFHRHHPLLLLQNPPYTFEPGTRNLKELEHVALEDPSFSSKNDGGNLIMVHKECISLPRIMQHAWHNHRVFHTYFIHKEYFRSLNCIWCYKVVDTEHGSYFCADCNVIFHVNCALKEKEWYCIVTQENEDDKSLDIPVNSITKVLEKNDAGKATLIEHCKHKHYLMLSDKISEHGDKCCDGCLLLISAKFYHCLRCDFFLHKSCAELSKIELIFYHRCDEEHFAGLKPFILTSDCMFECELCTYLSNGFSYKCNECGIHRVGHNCDDHPLKLTYHKINDYEKYHYCDICEEKRDPKYWFYHCETCDTSAHVDCVLGKYPLIKLGSTYNERDHPHPLTFAKKFPYYPKCVECGEPCEDLSLECAEPGCNYIVHWKCEK